MATRALRVAIGQRPALQLDALREVLTGAGFDVVCAETTTSRLSRAVGLRRPDLILAHDALDPTTPLGFVARLRVAAPGIPIVVLIDELSPGMASAVLAAELDGVVLGDASTRDLVGVLSLVADGEAVYPAGLLCAAHRADRESVASMLSSRQMDVLAQIADGLDNSSIAERLHISPNTVKFHIRAIYERLGVSNRVQAARLLERAEHPAPAPSTPPEWAGSHHLETRLHTTQTPVSRALRRA